MLAGWRRPPIRSPLQCTELVYSHRKIETALKIDTSTRVHVLAPLIVSVVSWQVLQLPAVLLRIRTRALDNSKPTLRSMATEVVNTSLSPSTPSVNHVEPELI